MRYMAPVPLTICRSNNRFRNSMKLCNALVHKIFDRSQRDFAHTVTVTLMCAKCLCDRLIKPHHSKFWSNFEFDRKTLSGVGARSGCSDWRHWMCSLQHWTLLVLAWWRQLAWSIFLLIIFINHQALFALFETYRSEKGIIWCVRYTRDRVGIITLPNMTWGVYNDVLMRLYGEPSNNYLLSKTN